MNPVFKIKAQGRIAIGTCINSLVEGSLTLPQPCHPLPPGTPKNPTIPPTNDKNHHAPTWFDHPPILHVLQRSL